VTLHRWRLAVLAASLAFASASVSAPAQETAPPATTADEKATVEDPAVAELLKATTAEREISEAAARRFGPMLFADGILSANERDLVRELLSMAQERTLITTAAGETFEIPPLSRQARAFIGLVQPPNLATLWLRGPVQMKQLVDVTVLSPDTARQVSGYILQRLNLVWMESTIANGYEPMRRDLSSAIRMLQQTDADTERQGRSLIYDAARQLDMRNGDAIPNYLYDYLR
jgi:hypothetical protein